jgi:hypothetical protein
VTLDARVVIFPEGSCSVFGTFGHGGVVVALRPLGDATAIVLCVPDPDGDGEAMGRACHTVITSIHR